MKPKTLLLLGTILTIAIVAIIMNNYLSQKKSSVAGTPFFPGLTLTNCSEFRMTDANGSVGIKRAGDHWVVETSANKSATAQSAPSLKDSAVAASVSNIYAAYPADSAAVVAAIEKLASMKKEDQISENPEKQNLFEVDTAAGLLVEAWDNGGKQVGAVIMGKTGPSWDSHFVRDRGAKQVYTVGGSVKYAFFTDNKRWRDKTVWRFPVSQIKKVTIAHRDSAAIVLEKKVDSTKTTWVVSSAPGVKTDSAAIANMINAIADITTINWEENLSISDSAMGFVKPTIVETIELDNGTSMVMTIGKKKDGGSDYYTRVTNSKALFLVNESRIKDFAKSMGELKYKEPAAAKPDASSSPAPAKKSGKKNPASAEKK